MGLLKLVKSLFSKHIDLRDPKSVEFFSDGIAMSGEPVNENIAMSLSAVWACTNLIASSIATMPVMVYRGRGGDREELRDHGLFRLLHDSPNAEQTAVGFWEFIGTSLELKGNAYAHKIIGAKGRIVAMVPIHPDNVIVERVKTGQLRYRWHDDTGRQHEAFDDEMLHIRGFGGSAMGGMSTLRFGRDAFGLARAIDKSAASTFRNGMRPSGALTFKEFLSEENRRTAERVLSEKFIGAVNSGRPLILEGDTRWQPISINPEDAQMLESRRFSVEEICRFFGVPPHMIGHTDKATSWGKGLEQQTLGFQKFTLRPRIMRIEQALMQQLLSPRDRASGVTIRFNMDGLLRGDSAARAAYYQTMTQIGAMTINEVREKEALPPVSGGDEPRMQMQNVPITEAGKDA